MQFGISQSKRVEYVFIRERVNGWTDIYICLLTQDFDEYRNELKDKIAKWLKKIKSNGNTEWLIIQVNSQGSLKGTKPKLQLPRSSVFDKIRSDFGGGKANDRLAENNRMTCGKHVKM